MEVDLERNRLRVVKPQRHRLGDVIDRAESALLRVGSVEARREAELMVSRLTGAPLGALRTMRGEQVSDEQFGRLKDWVERRGHREPLYYIFGECEFWSMPFKVAPAVLIPRSETELLVEGGVGFIRSREVEKPLVLDLCTGSGCVAVSVAKELPGAGVYGSDISREAVAIARENALANGQERVEFFTGDLFAAVSDLMKGRFDLIVSNPPYIPAGDIAGLQREVADYEPRAALDGGSDGLDIINRIVAEAPAYLRTGGLLALEVGFGQAGPASALLRDNGLFTQVNIRKDYSGIERIVSANRI